MSVGMTPIPLGHVENDWKCIAVNLGLLRVAVLIEKKKMHEKRLGAGETRGNGAFNKHCLQPNPGIPAPSIPMIGLFRQPGQLLRQSLDFEPAESYKNGERVEP